MAVEPAIPTFNSGDTAPTVRTDLNALGSQYNNRVLSMRRILQSGETATLYSYEDRIHIAPYTVLAGGHLVVSQGARVRVIN